MCRYKAPRPYFHTFEGDDAQVGLNFADEGEAEVFRSTVEGKLAERRQRREKRQASKRQQQQQQPAAKPPPTNGLAPPAALQPVQVQGRREVTKKGARKPLKKEDIGMPTNFQHISHVGWDPNHCRTLPSLAPQSFASGFDLENVDPNLKKFFQKAGVDEKALQDKDTRDFIYDFIGDFSCIEISLHLSQTSTGAWRRPCGR